MAASDANDLAIAVKVINQTAAELRAVKTSLSEIDATVKKIQPDFDAAGTAADTFAKKTAKSAGEASSAMRGFGSEIQKGIALGAGLSVVGVVAAGVAGAMAVAKDSVIGFNSQLQSAKAAFTGLLGSAQQADTFLKQLQQFAATTPFEFPDVLKASQRFLGMGVAANEVIPMLRDISTVVSAMGGGTEQINRVTVAISQMIAKNRVSAEEMNQLSEAGVQGWQMLAKGLDLPIAQVMKLAEEGQISAATFMDAWKKAANTPEMLASAKNMESTWQTATSNMKDGIAQFLQVAGKPLFDALTESALALSKWLTTTSEARVAAIGLANALKFLLDVVTFLPRKVIELDMAFLGWVASITGVKAGIDGVSMSATETAQSLADMAKRSEEMAGVEIRAAGIRAELAKASKAAAELQAQLKPIEAELKKQEDALRVNAGAIREQKAAADEVRASFDAQRKPLEENLRAIDAQSRAIKRQIEDTKAGYEAQRAPLEANLRLITSQQREVKAQIDEIKDAFEGIAEPIKRALGETETALRNNRREAEAVKTSYREQIEPLQEQVDLLTKGLAITNQQYDLQERIKDNQIKLALIDAEGDPIKKQVLVQRLAANELEQRGLGLKKTSIDLEKQLKDLEKQRKKGEVSRAEYELQKALIQSKQEQNKLDKASFDLIDKSALAEAKAAQYALQRSNEGRKIINDTEAAIARIQALPLEAQIAQLKQDEAARLETLNQQAVVLQGQADTQKDMLDALARSLAEQMAPLEARGKELQKQHDETQAALERIRAAETAAIAPLEARARTLQRAHEETEEALQRLKIAEQEQLEPILANLRELEKQRDTIQASIDKHTLEKRAIQEKLEDHKKVTAELQLQLDKITEIQKKQTTGAAAGQGGASTPKLNGNIPTAGDVDSSSPSAFFASIAPYALAIAERTGLSAATMMAIAANETGFGKAMVGNNLFGIKGEGPAGSISSKTWEEIDGQVVEIVDRFRAYNNVGESFADFFNFLSDNSRYLEALVKRSDASAFIDALKAAGYATDSQWPAKIKALLELSSAYLSVVDRSKLAETTLQSYVFRANDAERQTVDFAEIARRLGVDLRGVATDARNTTVPLEDTQRVMLLAAMNAALLSRAAAASASGFENQADAVETARDALYEYQKAAQKAGVKVNLDLTERIAVETGTGGAPSFNYKDFSPSDFGGLPQFANGGIMPGPLGQPGLAILHGGEPVLKAGQSIGTTITGPITINLPNVTDPRQAAEEIRRELLKIGRRNGYGGSLS